MSLDSNVLVELLAAFESGAPPPPHLLGTMAADEAYRLQIELLRHRRDAGAVHTGWKVGQTNAAMRAERGEEAPAPGFLLERGARESAAVIDLGGAANWCLEPELAVVVGTSLRGPGVTADEVPSALREVAPAFELVRRHAGWTDRALQRAVNGSNEGYVLGAPVAPPATGDALDAMRITLACDGASVVDAIAGEVNDNPYATVAWLANHLASLGESLEPGQVVLTGSYSALIPLAPDQRWTAEIGDLGAVTLTTQ